MARIVFDLDGTLIDSAPDIRAGANSVLATEGAAPLSLDETRHFIGSGTAVFVERMRAARDIPDSEQARLFKAFMEIYEDLHELTVPYPGVLPLLDALRGEGHALGICTNKPIAPCRAVLAHLDLTGYFDAVFGGDSLSQRKPDPAPLHATFAALGEGPRVYVGDSEVDSETAQRAQVPFLLFTEGYRRTPLSEIPHDAAFSDHGRLHAMIRDVL